MKKPKLSEVKDYFSVGAAILVLGSLLALPATLIISMIANDGMSLPTLLFLLALDFSVRSVSMGYIAYYLYIGDEDGGQNYES